MRSVAARALNELWRRHVFQLAVTFHGGMLAVAYEVYKGQEQYPDAMRVAIRCDDTSRIGEVRTACGAGPAAAVADRAQALPIGR